MEAVMLKKLFYVSASILMLAVAYHLGAGSAKAQAGLIEVGNIEYSAGTYLIHFVVGRTLYDTGWNPIPVPVPGSARIVAVGWGPDGNTALLENGDLYAWDTVNGWQHRNVFGSTAAVQPTFGQLKTQYRK